VTDRIREAKAGLRTAVPAGAGVNRRGAGRYAGGLLALAAAAAAVPAAPAVAQSAVEGTPWLAVFVAGPAGRLVPVRLDSEVTATFQAGQLSGSAGCNSYSAGYTIDQPVAGALRIGQAASTQRFCAEPPGVMDQEAAYLQALQRTARYAIANNLLLLQTLTGQVLTIYVPQPQRSLEGTSWTVIDFNTTQAITSVILGTEITAAFAGGTLSGSAGCNRYTASYTVTEGSNAITIGPPASTRAFCAEPPGIMDQEAAYLAALPTAQTYRFEGPNLRLERDGGIRVATFAPAGA
jgi:heat shock protein HslJ